MSPAVATSASELLDGGAPAALQVAAAVSRWLSYGGVLLTAGLVIFVAAARVRSRPDRTRLGRLTAWSALTAAGATVAGLVLGGGVLTGQGLGYLTELPSTAGVLRSNLGLSSGVRLVALSAVLVAVSRPARTRTQPVALLAALAALGSFLLVGHTVSSEPRWLVVGATSAHLLAGAVWLGGLAALGVLLARPAAPDEAADAARLVGGFSRLALASVVLVAGSGTALAWVQVGGARALVTTTYGVTLLIKAGVVAAVVAVAAYNNRRLVPAVQAGRRRGWSILARTVRIELVGLAIVLAASAVLVTLVPARTAAGTGDIHTEQVQLDDEHRLDVVVDPNRAGTNQVHVYVLEQDTGLPADLDADVHLVFERDEAQAEPVTVEPGRAGVGHYLHIGPELSEPGAWTLVVHVAPARGADVEVRLGLDVGR